MCDTTVYQPQIRALLGTASQFCEAAVLKSRTVPNSTTRSQRILRVIRRGAQAMYTWGEGGDGEEPGPASRPSASGQELLPRCRCIVQVSFSGRFRPHVEVFISAGFCPNRGVVF